MQKDGRFGFLILLGAAFFYATYGIFSKLIAGTFPLFFQAWTRGAISLVCFAIFGMAKKLFVPINKKDIKWFLIVSIIGSLAIAPIFYSLAYLNLGTALFIQYAATVITSYILGVLLLKEKLTGISYITFFLAIFGLLLVYWGDISLNKPLPVIASFIGGAFFSIYFVVSKKISQYSSIQINTLAYIFAFVINLVISMILREGYNFNFNSTAWASNIGYGVAGFLGSGLTIYGFKYIDANKGSIVLLTEILFGILFGMFLFKEYLGPVAILGGFFIILSIILPNAAFFKYKSSNGQRSI